MKAAIFSPRYSTILQSLAVGSLGETMGGGDLAVQVSTKLRDIFGWFESHFNVYLDHIGSIFFEILVLAFPSRKNIETFFAKFR